MIEISGHDGVELAPFPVPAIGIAAVQTVFASNSQPFGQAQVLITGTLGERSVDEVIEGHDSTIGESALRALFAFETIQS